MSFPWMQPAGFHQNSFAYPKDFAHLIAGQQEGKPMSHEQIDQNQDLRCRDLTSRWSAKSVAAQQALHDLWEIQCELDDLVVGTGSRDSLPAELLDHVDRIKNTDIDAITAELLASEREEAVSIEDGNDPTPEANFISEEEDRNPLGLPSGVKWEGYKGIVEEASVAPDHDKNGSNLNATIKGTTEAFRATK